MKIIRFQDSTGAVHHGSLKPDGTTARIEGEVPGDFRVTGEAADVSKLLAPISPVAILCIGLNYREHAEETGARIPTYPVLFTKGLGAVQNPGDPILLPAVTAEDEVDYEAELAVVIGKTGKNIPREEALSHVLGYTCANDVSARDWQKLHGGSQWCRGKGFDTFLPLGPAIVTTEEIPNPNDLGIRATVNGETLQDSNTSDMIFDVASPIEFLSQGTTLFAGTVILTGTPPGVGMARTPRRWLKAGDNVTIAVDGIGELSNPVGVE